MKHARIVEYATIAAPPSLGPGERVEVASRVQVGRVSVRRNLVLATLVAVVTFGGLLVFRVPKVLYLVLTDRRLLFLEPNELSGRPTTMVAAQHDRPALFAGPVVPGRVALLRPASRLTLALAEPDGSREELLLTFLGACRQDAPRLANALLVGR